LAEAQSYAELQAAESGAVGTMKKTKGPHLDEQSAWNNVLSARNDFIKADRTYSRISASRDTTGYTTSEHDAYNKLKAAQKVYDKSVNDFRKNYRPYAYDLNHISESNRRFLDSFTEHKGSYSGTSQRARRALGYVAERLSDAGWDDSKHQAFLESADYARLHREYAKKLGHTPSGMYKTVVLACADDEQSYRRLMDNKALTDMMVKKKTDYYGPCTKVSSHAQDMVVRYAFHELDPETAVKLFTNEKPAADSPYFGKSTSTYYNGFNRIVEPPADVLIDKIDDIKSGRDGLKSELDL
jgi:hypothetical protein